MAVLQRSCLLVVVAFLCLFIAAEEDAPCCMPASRGESRAIEARDGEVVAHGSVLREEVDVMQYIPGGEFLMGSDRPTAYKEDGEGPVRLVRSPSFRWRGRKCLLEAERSF